MLLLNMGSTGSLSSNPKTVFSKSSGKQMEQQQQQQQQHQQSNHKSANSKARIATKEKKTQQDELELLQITFYEIESWIEKTTPILSRMTNELEKASRHFDKRRKEIKAKEQQNASSHSTDTKHLQHTSQPEPSTHPSHIPQKSQLQCQENTQLPVTCSSLPSPSSTMPSTQDNENAMKWVLSFQPGNSLRLETNITSVEQLVEAVRKIRIVVESDPLSNTANDQPSMTKGDLYDEPWESNDCSDMTNNGDVGSDMSLSSSTRPYTIGVNPLATDPSTEYWNLAIDRRPQACLEKYKHCEMDLGRLTEDVSPAVLNHICQVYWDCLHPKFTCDWYSFWDRSGDPKRNQVCIDSGLAVVFLHVIRHQKNVCANALDIAYYYYDRARESLMEFFDSPDCATLETLLNLSLFCMVCKRNSQACIYISLAFRMMLEMGMNQRSRLPTDRVLRKKYLKLFMVLYYNDISTTGIYDETPIVNDDECDIDFYEVLDLNKVLFAHGEGGCDENMIAKETYFVHTLELARISKLTRRLRVDFQPYQHFFQTGELPKRWAKRIQTIETLLVQWFRRLQECYRVDPQLQPIQNAPLIEEARQQHPMSPAALTDHAALLLMLQFQTQWIVLHKPFLSPNSQGSPSSYSFDSPLPNSPSSSPSARSLPQQHTDRSFAICTDAANRIVAIAELITEQYGWCVCQQFLSCVYQASTIYCRHILSKDEAIRQNACVMIHRIIRVLASTKSNYEGLPNELTACLRTFLATHMASPSSSAPGQQGDSAMSTQPSVPPLLNDMSMFSKFNDQLPNSPHMCRHGLNQ